MQGSDNSLRTESLRVTVSQAWSSWAEPMPEFDRYRAAARDHRRHCPGHQSWTADRFCSPGYEAIAVDVFTIRKQRMLGLSTSCRAAPIISVLLGIRAGTGSAILFSVPFMTAVLSSGELPHRIRCSSTPLSALMGEILRVRELRQGAVLVVFRP